MCRDSALILAMICGVKGVLPDVCSGLAVFKGPVLDGRDGQLILEKSIRGLIYQALESVISVPTCELARAQVGQNGPQNI